MYVLVACEESQRVCAAFRKLGHIAFSCDIQECSGSHPEWHIKRDVLPLLDGFCCFDTVDGVSHFVPCKWDLIIAFPPCTYMTNAGACRMYPKKGQVDLLRLEKAYAAKEFFMSFYNCDCEHICIENPVPMKIVGLPNCSQIIQPFMFGHPYSKRTCLWLKGLPNLMPTDLISEGITPYVSAGSFNAKGSRRNKVGVSSSAKERSKTFEGVAFAMAEQWSASVLAGKGVVPLLDNGNTLSSHDNP